VLRSTEEGFHNTIRFIKSLNIASCMLVMHTTMTLHITYI